jgi:hypothetical protein
VPKLKIQLPKDRNYTGVLRVEDDLGRALAGPFLVCARANDLAASEHGNPRRLQALPYGDTPVGGYRVARTVGTGRGTQFDVGQFGRAGIIMLEPVSGEAAIAEANGRWFIGIHGGAPGAHGRLRSTNGCIRMRDEDVAAVIAAVAGFPNIICECTETSSHATSMLVTIDPDYDEGDPIPLNAGSPDAIGRTAKGPLSSSYSIVTLLMPLPITSTARVKLSSSRPQFPPYRRLGPITSRLRQQLTPMNHSRRLILEDFGLAPNALMSGTVDD